MSPFPKVHDVYVGRVVLGTVLATWAVLLGLDFIRGGLIRSTSIPFFFR